jgi:hypothetical protein
LSATDFNSQFGSDAVGENQLTQLMFEGLGTGAGKLKLEALRDAHVIATSSIDLNLRPLEQLYDHYSVSYGANVNQDGTFKSDFIGPDGGTNFDPLVQSVPVPTSANLVSPNEERARIQDQSDSYLLFVHGWNMSEAERIAYAEETYKRMFWSGYKGQVGLFDWPTEVVAQPVGDPGNFDRSEFVAWNSAAGLSDALHQIRANNLPSDGKLSVMAHSMGNIALAEALHMNETWRDGAGNKIVTTAVMSQAALSAHYFTGRTDLLPSIYTSTGQTLFTGHVTQTTSPSVTDYHGFLLNDQNLDAIGGVTPRFRNIGNAADKILNYYNPDDYALANWKLVQATKPTSLTSWGYIIGSVKIALDFRNVSIPWPDLEALYAASQRRQMPGFANTSYQLDGVNNANYTFNRVYRTYSEAEGWVETNRVALSFAANKYEMFAFGASSTVAAVGGVNSMDGLMGVFTAGRDLRSLPGTVPGATKFTTANTGHSAEFADSYSGVIPYWNQLMSDIQ